MFDIANQLLTRLSPLAPLTEVDVWAAKPSSFSIQGRLSKFFGFWLLKYWKILITYKQRRSNFSRQKRKPRYEKKNSVALEMAFLVAENENRQLEDLLQADFGPVPSVSKDYSQKLRILYIENWAHCLFL